jgi:propanol-preferring alcohol dehydrogenase
MALQAVLGGTVVCAGIHTSDIPASPAPGCGERRIVSVANPTPDGDDFLRWGLMPYVTTHSYPLHHALDDLRAGRFAGAAVLRARSTG